jgi:3-hydroxymyristoyl/3-hydroxydecanoyl-(acyl carrier protein) dehydratase
MTTSSRIGLSIAKNHPAFAGHFPGMPVVPGVVLLDEALHAIGEQLGIELSACEIRSLKFLSPLVPGEPAFVLHEMTDSGTIRFEIVSGERKVASGMLRPATRAK